MFIKWLFGGWGPDGPNNLHGVWENAHFIKSWLLATHFFKDVYRFGYLKLAAGNPSLLATINLYKMHGWHIEP